MFAAEQGHEMVVLLLLDHGADIDFKQVVATYIMQKCCNAYDAMLLYQIKIHM